MNSMPIKKTAIGIGEVLIIDLVWYTHQKSV